MLHRARNYEWAFAPGCCMIEGHASTLYSEDLQHGQMLDSLRVVDPFA